jgi:hypothetical protein
LLIFVFMKKGIFLVFILAFAHPVFCQPQNLSFELWDVYDPSYWATSNFYTPGSAIQSIEPHGGAFALNMNVVLDSNGTAIEPYALNIFPLTTMPQVLTYWIKGNLQANNTLNANFILAETDSNANTLAYGDQTLTSVSNVYTYKFLNILPLSGPSLLGQGSIYFGIYAPVGSTLNTNSTVIIDDLYLGVDNTGIFEYGEKKDVIEKIYPNPCADLAYLVFNQKSFGPVTLKVYDLLGNLVLEVLNGNMAEGKYKAEIETTTLTQGLYYCKLNSGGIDYSIKLVKR